MSKLRLRRLARQPWGMWEVRTLPRSGPGYGENWADDAFVNNRYSVQVSRLYLDGIGWMDHLWVRRHDGRMTNSWADLQLIKDQLCGAERVAVQVYPAHSELVDEANMAHLWVYPQGYRLPFRLHPSQEEPQDG